MSVLSVLFATPRRAGAALVVAVFAWALSGPAQSQSQSQSQSTAQEVAPPAAAAAERIAATYRLASGDRIQINVFGHPDLSGEFEVDGAGNVTFPLLGPVRAGGQTVEALRGQIETDLNRDYLVDPSVTVEVLNYRPFFILGQVNAPGSYAYQAGMTVRQAVALAGGYTRRARTSSMQVIRQTDDGPQELEVDENALVYPGDTIEVERRFF